MDKEISTAIENLGILELTPMQAEFIHDFKKHKNILLLSPTGSGKTLAYLLPLLSKIKTSNSLPCAMVISPTRELARQIQDVFRSLKTGYKSTNCYGGHSRQTEKISLEQSPHLIIGTPGRICDHIREGNIPLEFINTMIIDEYDKCLEMGFLNDISFIINKLSPISQIVLCSASYIPVQAPVFENISFRVLNYLLEENISNNLFINIIRYEKSNKIIVLYQLLCNLGLAPAMVFCNHREAVDRVFMFLIEKGLHCVKLHGGLDQSERDMAMIRFSNGSNNILITTDLASRGIDISDIQNVIHYQLPPTPTGFLHRNGRTARMNNSGSVFLFIEDGESIPEYAGSHFIPFELKTDLPLPEVPKWDTLFIGAGKKEKISKSDVVGFLIKQAGLTPGEIGRIDIFDRLSYAAVCRKQVNTIIKRVKDSRIKNLKVRISKCR